MQFSRFIAELADGEAHQQLTEALERVSKAMRVRALADHRGVRGEITLKIKLTTDERLVVDASYDVTTKEPKPPRPASVMWLDKFGNLTPENPRQEKLPLREVKVDRGEVRDADEPAAGVRSV